MDERIVVIHQPDFMPYLGFFDRLCKADIYVILDTVQYVRNTSRAWTSRDKIKTKQGEKWITISTQKAPRDTAIKDILLSDEIPWKENNLNLIKENYHKSLFYDEIFPYVEQLYSTPCEKLVDFNIMSIQMLIDLFDIEIDIRKASDMDTKGKNNTLVVDIVKKVGCHKYLSGIGARDYYDPMVYKNAGIEVIWQDFKHPVYPQQFGDFIPNLSSIDLLFNCGIEKSKAILRGESWAN